MTAMPPTVNTALAAGGAEDYKAIDAQIQRLRNELLELLPRRNNLQPISRLAPELLARIFRFTVSANNGDRWRRVPKWVVVSHVCQRWRVIALGDSMLWTSISLDWSTACARTVFERSNQAKLYIVLPEKSSSIKSLVIATQALSNTSRVKTLESNDPSFAHVIKGLGSKAPHLEALALRNYHHRDAHTLPPGFLAGKAPRLKTFQLLNWSLSPWRSPLLTTLENFDLTLNADNRDLPSPIEMLDILMDIPTLSCLRLAGSGIPRFDEETDRIVKLPQLKSLAVHSVSVKTCTSVLHVLAIPQTARVDIFCDQVDKGLHSMFNFGAAFSACCFTSLLNPSNPTSLPAFKYIAVALTWSLVFTASLQHPTEETDFRGSHRLRMWPRDSESPAVLPSLLESLCLEEVCRVDLSGSFPSGSSSGIIPLLRLPRVETVHISETRATIQFLEQVMADAQPSDSSISLPGLKNLSISRTNFRHHVHFQKLASFLSFREANGVKIQRLRLDGCSILKRDGAKLKSQCHFLEL
ncbi:hypothetical protein BKA70DRAFT_1252787 [Coprinopsis sp. MPI-PUGE-AT-0042]|nr:hypothetical protein BKA70DRAFT_1252787 [Coprinopsis sp. MPI-PUGE-AT-0042]